MAHSDALEQPTQMIAFEFESNHCPVPCLVIQLGASEKSIRNIKYSLPAYRMSGGKFPPGEQR